MKVKITHTTQYLIGTRDIKEGDIYDVVSTGISESKSGKKLYLIYSKNGLATVMYVDEVEEILPKPKKLKP